MEAQSDGVGGAWPTVQIDAYFAASNALSAMFGNQPTDIIGHAHYTSRKIDPATAGAVQGPWSPSSINSSGTWSLDDMRAEAARRATTTPTPTPEVDDVPDIFTHSEPDHAGHPPRFTYWRFVNPTGAKRVCGELELDVAGVRDTAPAYPMSTVDSVPDA